MKNYCAKHNQFYSDYCVYCGNPIQIINKDATSFTCGCSCHQTVNTGGENIKGYLCKCCDFGQAR